MNRTAAESIALQALAFIAGSADHLARFMAETGLAAEDLRTRASEPTLLAGVLDFLLADEARLPTRGTPCSTILGFCRYAARSPSSPETRTTWRDSFCRYAALAPERPARARALLPGAARE